METLTVLAEADGRVLKTMTVMNRPERIVIDPRANRIYVANTGAGTLSVIDARSDAIIAQPIVAEAMGFGLAVEDRKSTRLNSSHSQISYAVFCLKKKKTQYNI